MVGRRVRNVMVGVAVRRVVIIVRVVVAYRVRDRSQRVIKMRLGREMDGNEIDVESEADRDEQTAPQTRPVGRVARSV